MTCSSWQTLIRVDGHTQHHQGPGQHPHLPLSPPPCLALPALFFYFHCPSLPVSCHHVMSDHCLAGQALSRAPGRELPYRHQDGHPNNGVLAQPRQARQSAETRVGLTSAGGRKCEGARPHRCSHTRFEENKR